MIRGVVAAVALAAFAVPAQAQTPLQAMAFLEGCWVGSFEGADLRDERCFTPMHGGNQWRDVHEVVGTGYGGETIYAWDAEAGQIVATYYASDGALMRGVVTTEEGVLVMRDGRYVSPSGEVQHLRSRWIRQGDGFVTETERLEEGGWRPFMRIVFERAEP